MASSERVWLGVGRERGWADSSPACGEAWACATLRKGVEGAEWETAGEWGSECGRDWMASSTYLWEGECG